VAPLSIPGLGCSILQSVTHVCVGRAAMLSTLAPALLASQELFVFSTRCDF
jgi:hypothetical protein